MTSKRGQALLELAVFGAVALAALGFLIRIGMQMNFEQEIRMAAFRRALWAAAHDNGTDQDAMAVTYHYISDRQMPNPTDGYMSLPRNRTEASAFVEWGQKLTFAYEQPGNTKRGRQTHQLIAVRSNNNENLFRQNDFPENVGNKVANTGIVSESFTTNNSGTTFIMQSSGRSSLVSSTSTASRTKLNTKNSDSISSTTGGGGGKWSP